MAGCLSGRLPGRLSGHWVGLRQTSPGQQRCYQTHNPVTNKEGTPTVSNAQWHQHAETDKGAEQRALHAGLIHAPKGAPPFVGPGHVGGDGAGSEPQEGGCDSLKRAGDENNPHLVGEGKSEHGRTVASQPDEKERATPVTVQPRADDGTQQHRHQGKGGEKEPDLDRVGADLFAVDRENKTEDAKGQRDQKDRPPQCVKRVWARLRG